MDSTFYYRKKVFSLFLKVLAVTLKLLVMSSGRMLQMCGAEHDACETAPAKPVLIQGMLSMLQPTDLNR